MLSFDWTASQYRQFYLVRKVDDSTLLLSFDWTASQYRQFYFVQKVDDSTLMLSVSGQRQNADVVMVMLLTL